MRLTPAIALDRSPFGPMTATLASEALSGRVWPSFLRSVEPWAAPALAVAFGAEPQGKGRLKPSQNARKMKEE